jgi:large subunit ribosomal protein L24
MPIDASNVALVNPETDKADKVGFRVEGEAKIRFFKSTGKAIDA